jgi:hypothetical protein
VGGWAGGGGGGGALPLAHTRAVWCMCRHNKDLFGSVGDDKNLFMCAPRRAVPPRSHICAAPRAARDSWDARDASAPKISIHAHTAVSVGGARGRGRGHGRVSRVTRAGGELPLVLAVLRVPVGDWVL